MALTGEASSGVESLRFAWRGISERELASHDLVSVDLVKAPSYGRHRVLLLAPEPEWQCAKARKRADVLWKQEHPCAHFDQERASKVLCSPNKPTLPNDKRTCTTPVPSPLTLLSTSFVSASSFSVSGVARIPTSLNSSIKPRWKLKRLIPLW